MTLKLTRPAVVVQCPVCNGKGKMPLPTNFARNGQKTPCSGALAPCPECNGKKVVLR